MNEQKRYPTIVLRKDPTRQHSYELGTGLSPGVEPIMNERFSVEAPIDGPLGRIFPVYIGKNIIAYESDIKLAEQKAQELAIEKAEALSRGNGRRIENLISQSLPKCTPK